MSEEKSKVYEVVEVPFHGHTIAAARDGGEVWVPVPRLCETFGLAYSAQLTKLKSKPWATMSSIDMVAADGKVRKVTCLERRCIPIWAATIDSERVSDACRTMLELYQKDAADVLANHFFGPRGDRAAPAADDLRRFVAQEVAALGQSLAADIRLSLASARPPLHPQDFRPVFPRDWVRQQWRECSGRTLEWIVARCNQLHHHRTSEYMPRYGDPARGPYVLSPDNLHCLMDALGEAWAREHPPAQPPLPFPTDIALRVTVTPERIPGTNPEALP